MAKLVKEILSNNKNKIQLLKAESNTNSKGKTILFIAVVHGDEPEGEPLIYSLINEIEKNPSINSNNTILLIPVLNPDGKGLKTRVNANGVDINRNFPTQNWSLSLEKDTYYSGPLPASEVETQFVIDVISEYCPDIIITLHTPYRVVNYDGPAKELAENISKLNGYPVQENIGYPTPGSFGTYAGIERNIPIITLELPDNESIEKLWNDNKSAFLNLIQQ